MKYIINGSLALCAASMVTTLALMASGPIGAQSVQKPAQRISFKTPIGGNERRDEKRDEKKASPFTAQEQTVDGHKWGIVMANGKGVMGIPVEAGGFTPLQRAQMVSERMGNLYKAGARFKLVDGYVAGKLNGEIVLAIKPDADSRKLELLFTVDSNLDRMLNAQIKGKKPTRADIAFYWRDLLVKALQDQPDIAMSSGEKDAWARIPAGYGRDKPLPSLAASQLNSSKK